ncbi:MAG: sulfotransferase family protein [Planctomycetota bacterium]|jgi:hypothetical protein
MTEASQPPASVPAAPPDGPAPGICVFGMHRSGTSLACALLDALGVTFGAAEAMLPPAPDNPMGFFELEAAVALNNRALRAWGGTWDAPPPDEWPHPQPPDLTALRVPAARLLQEQFAGRARWGLKDPRLCLTWPLWRPLAPAWRFVLCVRDPRDSAGSLTTRDGLPATRGIELWSRYMESAVRFSAGRPRVVLEYSRVLANPEHELDRLVQALDLEPPDPQRRAAALARVSPDLRRHRLPAAERENPDALPGPAAALLAVLRALAADPTPMQERLGDVLAQSLIDRRTAERELRAEAGRAAGAEARARAAETAQAHTAAALHEANLAGERHRAEAAQRQAEAMQRQAAADAARLAALEHARAVESALAETEGRRIQLTSDVARLRELLDALYEERAALPVAAGRSVSRWLRRLAPPGTRRRALVQRATGFLRGRRAGDV